MGANVFAFHDSRYVSNEPVGGPFEAYASYDQDMLQPSASGSNPFTSNFNCNGAPETNANALNQELSTREAPLGVNHFNTPSALFGQHSSGILMPRMSPQLNGGIGNVIGEDGLWNNVPRCYYLS